MHSTGPLGIGILAVSLILPVAGCAAPINSSPKGFSSPTESQYERPVTTTTSQAAIPPPPVLPVRPADDTIEEIVEDTVLARSQKMGATLNSAEWQNLRTTICDNLEAGGAGLYLSQSANVLTPEDQWPVADLYLDGAISGTCTTAKKPPPPAGHYYASDVSLGIPYLLQASYTVNDIKYRGLITKYIKDVGDYGRRYGVDVSYLLDAVPGLPGASGSTSGYDVVCADGWVSSSGGKQGACSHHGGVR